MGDLGRALSWFLLFSSCLSAISVATETDVKAYVGTSVALPCRVDTKQCGQLHSVKWYKDANRVYVLSHAGQGRAEGDATERMAVEYNNTSIMAFLKISPVEGEDEATYKCEITYLEVIENCDVVQIVKLKTLKKPEKVEIHHGQSNAPISNSTVLGPYGEGDELDLTCIASRGKPIPLVKWYNGTTEITRAVYATKDMSGGFGEGESTLHLTLTRGDLLARFECRVQSEALDEPIISWISIDVHVRPTDINLTGVEDHVVQGTNVKLDCKVQGAKPAASVRWANGSFPIVEEELQQSTQDFPITTKKREEKDGTFTTISSLSFKASHYENGKTIFCYAENEVMQTNADPELKASLILDVRYPPVITVKPLNTTVNESTDSNVTSVFLQCIYFANPQDLKSASWLKDGKPLNLSNSNKFVGGTVTNPPLYINNVTRDDMGEYSCSLKNEIGTETSEDSIFLNVQHPPEVVVIMEPSTPIKAVDKSNVMLFCNVTSGNPSTLLKVRWSLGGEVMKELPECNYTSFDENGFGEGSGGPFCGLDPSILSLERVDESFAGNYTCRGKNVAGWGPESEPQELIVYYPPSPAKIVSVPSKVVKGGSVTLTCSIDHPGRPENITYLWYRGEHLMAEITSSNFTISPVRLEVRSNFTCIAKNEGGKSLPASTYVNVNAPPSFIKKLNSYQGVLYSAKDINLTCRVECFPECSIVWHKDNVKLDLTNTPLYYVETQILPADLQTNDFESINSTLIWNMTAWPNGTLNKNAPNSAYTCQATSNKIGPGISSTIEIAVDYPPEELQVSKKIVHVVEHQAPSPVKCHGKGHPALSYQWKKNMTSDPIANTEDLVLGPMSRTDSGQYICIATNKHGMNTSMVYFNVQYAPACSISTTEKNGSPALICTADANPQEVSFYWMVRELNETFIETNNVKQEGLKSYLLLDSSVDTFRTYMCYVNNTVGSTSVPCERDVAGNLPWWKQLNQDKLIIIIASIVAIIIVVIIICIIIIILCRRKRADTKSPNPSSIEDKARLGSAAPLGGTADHLTDSDKGFYENLPFHGMQNPPNKPISIIAPFNQGNNAPSLLASTKSLISSNSTFSHPPINHFKLTGTIKRNQSFSGFQNTGLTTTSSLATPIFSVSGNINNGYLNSYPSQQFREINTAANQNRPISFIPTIFSYLPTNFAHSSGINTIAGIPISQLSYSNHNRTLSFGNIEHINNINTLTPRGAVNNKESQRVIGRRESYYDIRKTASGINNTPKAEAKQNADNQYRGSSRKLSTIVEKRFGSLDIRKHKCYSPTFYSMRCKKHAKRRPIIVTLPKKCFSDLALSSKSTEKKPVTCDTSSDSIQIFEENNLDPDTAIPVPAPRNRKYKKAEIVYANISKHLNILSDNQIDTHDTSTESTDLSQSQSETITEAQIHSSNPIQTDNNEKNNDHNSTVSNPVLVSGIPKTPILSQQALKNSPILKVSPNFVKPKTESPKGALSKQIQAKLKTSPIQSPKTSHKIDKSQKNNAEITEEHFPSVPQMPVLNPSNKWICNITNTNIQNAFYTLTTPHLKQINMPPQYSATIPHHPKHAKLIPKALFQEQLPKSKSFSSKSKQKKNHFQIPLQKCHSFKFQTAESYFQPIKNIHEQNLMRNGYLSDYPEESVNHNRHHKRDKKQKSKGPLVLRRPNDYQENIHFQANMQNSVQLQYPQPLLGHNMHNSTTNKTNGVVYADLDIESSNSSKKHQQGAKNKSHKSKSKTEYATLKFNDVGQEIDV